MAADAVGPVRHVDAADEGDLGPGARVDQPALLVMAAGPFVAIPAHAKARAAPTQHLAIRGRSAKRGTEPQAFGIGAPAEESYVDAAGDRTIEQIEQLNPTRICISPGPCTPHEAGITLPIIRAAADRIPIFGVCLGHQCLAYAFGTQIIKAPEIIHGKTSPIVHNKKRLFRGLPSPFPATRYHSLAIECTSLPDCFSIDAWADKTIMAISHRQYPVFGLQFHPEAILTDHGLTLLNNFLHYDY